MSQTHNLKTSSSVSFHPNGDCITGTAYGQGEGVEPGDFLILPDDRYRVTSISYDDDYWKARVIIAPRLSNGE